MNANFLHPCASREKRCSLKCSTIICRVFDSRYKIIVKYFIKNCKCIRNYNGKGVSHISLVSSLNKPGQRFEANLNKIKRKNKKRTYFKRKAWCTVHVVCRRNIRQTKITQRNIRDARFLELSNYSEYYCPWNVSYKT